MSFSCPLEMEVVKCESIYSNIWLRFCYEYETTFESDINKRENNQCRLVDDFCRKMPIRAFQQSPSRSPGLLLRPHWKSHFRSNMETQYRSFFPGFCTMLMPSSFIRAKFYKQDLSSSLLQIPKEIWKLRFLEHFFVLTCPWLGTSTPLPPAFPLMRSPVSRPPEHKQTSTLTSTKSSSTFTKLVRPASKILVSVSFLGLRQIN